MFVCMRKMLNYAIRSLNTKRRLLPMRTRLRRRLRFVIHSHSFVRFGICDVFCVHSKKKHQDRVQSKIRFHHIQNPTHLNTCSWDSTLQTYPHRYSHKSKLNYDHNLGSWRWGIICANRTSAIHCFSLVPRI